jgi:hypothetical protein
MKLGRLAWKYALFSPISVIIFPLLIALSFKYEILAAYAFIFTFALALPYLCLVVAAREGLVHGNAKWLPLLQVIEYPFFLALFTGLFAPQETQGEGGWGPAIFTLFGFVVMAAAAVFGYILSAYFESRYKSGKPVNKYIFLLVPLAIFLIILFFFA